MAACPRGPGGAPTQQGFSQRSLYPAHDLDRTAGCIRDVEHAYSSDGGLAVLTGNIAVDGCFVKTPASNAANLRFEGPARVFHSRRPPAKRSSAIASSRVTSS
jgi:dihydroxy-acid dehydratase